MKKIKPHNFFGCGFPANEKTCSLYICLAFYPSIRRTELSMYGQKVARRCHREVKKIIGAKQKHVQLMCYLMAVFVCAGTCKRPPAEAGKHYFTLMELPKAVILYFGCFLARSLLGEKSSLKTSRSSSGGCCKKIIS